MRTILLLSIGISILAIGQPWGATWYVDDSVSSSGDGTSWGMAFKTIQQGINAASGGDTVLVAMGTYYENIHFGGKNIVLTSTDPLDSSVVASTIMDGGHAGAVVGFYGTENETCVLSGFVIRNGYRVVGGGIIGNGARATIENNVITGNEGASEGGGLHYCDGIVQNNYIGANTAQAGGALAHCNGTIRNNTIAGNSATAPFPAGNGGGLALCDGTIEQNVITGNSAEGRGGGGLSDCDGTIRNNTISDNSAALDGGGLLACLGTIEQNTITGNKAWSDGGGLSGCGGTIQNNTISNNSAEYAGGLGGCNGTIQNNTITGNSAEASAGGLLSCNGTIQNNTIAGNSAVAMVGGGLSWCGGTIQNNTIVGNSAASAEGGGLYDCDGEIQNCIIWGNTAPTGAQLYASSDPTFSCVEGWAGGGSNTGSNPRFVDSDGPDDDPMTFEDNNYRLSAYGWLPSPCIDSGKNDAWMWSAVDLDGNPRVFFGLSSVTVDMGAYEYGSFPFKIMSVGQVSGFPLQVKLGWNSRPGDTYLVWSGPSLPKDPHNWTLEAEVPSEGKKTSWTDPAPMRKTKFYLVELKLTP